MVGFLRGKDRTRASDAGRERGHTDQIEHGGLPRKSAFGCSSRANHVESAAEWYRKPWHARGRESTIPHKPAAEAGVHDDLREDLALSMIEAG
jgi:hypothetical protein